MSLTHLQSSLYEALLQVNGSLSFHSTVGQLPPSSAQMFLRKAPGIPVVIVADYDQEFKNRRVFVDMHVYMYMYCIYFDYASQLLLGYCLTQWTFITVSATCIHVHVQCTQTCTFTLYSVCKESRVNPRSATIEDDSV